ncbi:MAG: DNA cytosine methyltransferase [Deltaproteobacteria bacterium]|nr:DNA cytosine methyltransferase [Deltaproteobacteria bacterium]
MSAAAVAGLSLGSLFSGIGGIEAGMEAAGHGPVKWQVEADEFRRERVLPKHWPGVARFERVADVGVAQLCPVDCIIAGFPCGDLSVAGKGAGLDGARSGLWSEARRIVGELAPEWVVIENVAGAAKRWVDFVRRDLGQLGYATLPVELQARYVGLPHQRARIFVVAHAKRDPLRLGQQRVSGRRAQAIRDEAQSELVDASSPGRWETLPPIHRSDDGATRRLDAARIAGCGVAVVPQCAQIVGELINLMREAA